MEIPQPLIDQIFHGEVVLFLGSGASRDALDDNNNNPPGTKELKELLSDKFLGGEDKDASLKEIADYAISQRSLFYVQDYIREIFEGFNPSEAHLTIPEFKWRAIITTNYDRLIEVSYEKASEPLQQLRTFIKDFENIDDKMNDSDCLKLLKLHGCISNINDENCPLIISTDQYEKSLSGRKFIFRDFEDLGNNNSIVFIGYSIGDWDIRNALQIATNRDNRPRHYLVIPEISRNAESYWMMKKVTPIRGSFENFIDSIDKKIDKPLRKLRPQTKVQKSKLFEKLVRDQEFSSYTINFISNDAEYVKDMRSTKVVDPNDFYKGDSSGWGIVEQKLDVRRDLCDTIISDSFFIDESEHSDEIELIVIKAHAGAGKTVFLKRIAWEASFDYDLLCIFLNPYGNIIAPAIEEIIRLTDERVFLFIDNATDYIKEIQKLIRDIGRNSSKLTIIVAARTKEWNMYSDPIESLVTKEYDIQYLKKDEIKQLVTLLEKYDSLGILKNKSQEERIQAIEYRHGRQILVALHEATRGKKFPEIIKDEYENIIPLEAQRIYLSICLFNRMGLLVRAGLISRIYEINFNEFEQRFFKPLERVVFSKYHTRYSDYLYSTRHPHIAQMVFEEILIHAEDRYDEYVKCLSNVNLDYSTDYKAFVGMIKANSVLNLFNDHQMISNIYSIAEELVGRENKILLHQRAIYEMKRPNGNLSKSLELISRAHELDPDNNTIMHTKSEILLRKTDQARSKIEEKHYFNEAENIAHGLLRRKTNEEYAFHTLNKINLKKIRLLLNEDDDSKDIELKNMLENTEKLISSGLRKYPQNPELLKDEADLGRLLHDSQRTINCLEKAFQANPRKLYIVLGLCKAYESLGRKAEQKTILEKALESNPNERMLNYKYAKILLEEGDERSEAFRYHIERSYIESDTNYDARILLARMLFIEGELSESKKIFNRLKKARVAPRVKSKPSYPIDEEFFGSIVSLEPYYCWIKSDKHKDNIYSDHSNTKDSVWTTIRYDMRVKFKLAFNFNGPIAIKLMKS